MVKEILYSDQAIRFLKKLTEKDRTHIYEKIEQYAKFPNELKNQVKKLQGVKAYRLRIGDYRVIFDDNGVIIEIIRIGNRGDIYRGV